MSTEVFPGVTVSPGVRFGRPVVKGTRIDTALIETRWLAGELLAEIAVDLGQEDQLEAGRLEQALRFEARLRERTKAGRELRQRVIDAGGIV